MTAVGCQVADLQPIHAQRRALARDPAFSRWTGELRSPVWAAALPHYDKIVLFHSVHCGPASTTFEGPSYLAGFYGLSINDGISSRWSTAEEQTYCQRLTREMLAGQVEDAALYLVHRSYEQLIRKNAPHLVCGDVDSLLVCVTSRSYQYWRNAAEFR